MASTFSDLKIELIGTGEQVGTWGITTNTNLGTAIEEAVVGSANVSFSSSDVTLTLTNTNGTQTARHLRLNLTGTSGGARNLILGSGCQIDKPYIINNGLADTVTVKNTTGTGVAVPAGKTMWVYNNGTNVVEAMNHAASLTLGSALPVASGGTGATAAPTLGGVIYGNGTAYAVTSVGASGQALVSNGSSAPSWQNVANANTAGAIVARDGSGNFSAGTITADLTGGASQVNVSATTSSDTTTYPLLVGDASTGNQTPFIDTGLSYNANTNALTATTFVGNLSGNATSATSATSATTATTLSTASGVAPSYSIRAWVNFSGTGTTGQNQSIRAGGNVSSVFKSGTGSYTLNFAVSLIDANYAVVGLSQRGSVDSNSQVMLPLNGTYTASQVQIRVAASQDAATVLDAAVVNVLVIR
jgi:hypothetical protein